MLKKDTITMKILILSAFPTEQNYYKNKLEILSSFTIGFVETTECKTASATIYLATTGMGTINASLVLATLVAHLNPDAIFFSGTAGAIDPELKIGDVIVGEDAFDADILSVHDAVLGTPFESALINPNTQKETPRIYSSNAFLRQKAISSTSPAHKFFFGRIATSNHFPAPKPLFEQIKSHHAMIIDMESAAIYQFGWLSQLPVLVIRGVSNQLNHQGEDDDIAASDVNSSSEHAAELVLDCIEAITLETIPSLCLSKQPVFRDKRCHITNLI